MAACRIVSSSAQGMVFPLLPIWTCQVFTARPIASTGHGGVAARYARPRGRELRMVPHDGREPRQSIAIQRQPNRRFVADDLSRVDVVVGHRHAVAWLDHDLAYLDDRGTAFGRSIIGAAIEHMPFAAGDGGVHAPDAVVVRR